MLRFIGDFTVLALIYLIVMVTLGDSICRRFYSFVSLPHRFAAAFITGLLVSSWFTYLAALLFWRASQPLLWGNLLFFAAAAASIFRLRRRAPNEGIRRSIRSQIIESNKGDWVAIGIFFVFACVLEFATLNMSAGKLQISNLQWSDFGSTVSIMQSFALGHNFPTELPHFSGERIHYHFLFYFLAGNLEYLGLNPALSNNILSILSLVSMLVLVMTLGVVLFGSRAVGRIGAALFFFHGSLSFIPFFLSQDSISGALNAIWTLHDFLPSGFPYRGETWGVWSQDVYLNQRHLPSSIGIFLLVLVFVISRYRAALLPDKNSNAAEPNQTRVEPATNVTEPEVFPNNSEPETSPNISEPETLPDISLPNGTLKSAVPFIFSGVLLGLLPMWNSAVFIAAGAVLAVLFLLLPLKKQMLALAVTTAIVALPQAIFLKTGNVQSAGYSLFHWGYIIDDPTVKSVVEYIGFTFGFKWLLIAVALLFATKLQRRVLIAVMSLVAVAFFFQFSQEILANHKFLNVWLVIANLFVAYGLYRLWKMRLLKNAFLGKIAAIILAALITIGGVIDLFPVHNAYWIEMPFEDDPLVSWVTEKTDPKAIFLSNRYVNHSILLAGRLVFYGHPYYAQSAGYSLDERERVFKQMFAERNPQELLRILKENNISYVAIDNGLRSGDFIKNVNEAVYKGIFEKVFDDTNNRYDGLAIYKVPANLSDVPASLLQEFTVAAVDTSVPAVNAFEGGQGRGRGQFDAPRGVAVDAAGDLYIADSGNARVQKFSPDGNFLAAFGKPGTGEGEFRAPNGITVDSNGNIYVADAHNGRLYKFNADGTFEKQWNGPPPGFYGPRDAAVGPYRQLYVLDQGRNRVVRLDPDGEGFAEWGQKGENEGEFSDATGLDVAGGRVFVADAGNGRIQIFDLDGKFVRQWIVPEWDKSLSHFPDVAFDAQTKRLYATSGGTSEILVFDADGNRLESLKPVAPDKLDNPSSLVLSDREGEKRLYVLSSGGGRVTQIKLGKTTGRKK